MNLFKTINFFVLLIVSLMGMGQSVTSVSSTAADRTYKLGDVIPITVTFNENVTVRATPQITLETGSSDAVVDYTSGSGTSTLTFNYTVAAGNNSINLDYVGTESLRLPPPKPEIPMYMRTRGAAFDVAISGNYAYVTDYKEGLAIVDISDPKNPSTPVYRATLGSALGVAISDNYAYVADGWAGLAIIDITDPTSPGTPVQIPLYNNRSAHSVKVSGNYAYVAATSLGLAIIDISDPTNPGTPVYVDTNGEAIGLDIRGNYAYVADFGTGLAIIDISDPTIPSTPIYVDTNSAARAVAVSGNYAYVTDSNSGLAIINISNPTNPETPIYRDTNGTAYDVAISGNYAYLADYNKGLAIIDISNPTSPGAPIYRDTDTNALAIIIRDNYAYLADYSSGLVIIPTNASNITGEAGNAATLTLSSPGSTNSLGANKTIVIDGTLPTVTGVTSTTANGSYHSGAVIEIKVGFSEIVNVTGTPQLTLETGSKDAVVDYNSGTGTDTITFKYTVSADHNSPDLDYLATSSLALNSGSIKDAAGNNAILTLVTPGGTNSLGNNKDIFVDGVELILTGVTSINADSSYETDDVIAIKIGFNENVIVTGTPQLTLETGSNDAVVDYTSGTGTDTLTFNYTVASNHISSDLDYLATNSLTLPAPNPKRIKATGTTSMAVTISGNYAFVANDPTGVSIINISDPTSPTEASKIRTNGRPRSVKVSGNYAYWAEREFNNKASLAIIDVSDPTNPGTPVYVDVNADISAVRIFGSYAYLAARNAGLAIINISDPVNPGTPVYVYTSEFVYDVYIFGSYAYVFASSGNHAIIDISNPASPGTPVLKNGIFPLHTVRGNYAYVTGLFNDSFGLAIIDISDPTSPGTPVFRGTKGTVGPVAISGNYAYVACGREGLAIIDISDPKNPGLPTYTDLGYYNNNRASDIKISGNYAYVANGYGNLEIIATNASNITDEVGNAARLTLSSPGSTNSLGANKAIVVNNGKGVPSITAVTSTIPNNTYKLGDLITIKIVFSEAVIVRGTPQLTLETGSKDAVVDYSSGTGTDTLTFKYTVSADHNSPDLDYGGISSLALNGGTINSLVGNTAMLTLPSPGATNSLGANKAIVIDGIAPIMLINSSQGIDGFASKDSTLFLTFTSSEATTDFTIEDITVSGGAMSSFLNISDDRYTSTFTPSGEDIKTIKVAAGVFKDAAGNENLASGEFNWIYEVDNNVPQISDVTFNLAENSPNGTFVGAIEASDADVDTLTYTILTGNTDQAFGLNVSTGVLSVTTSTALDYETKPIFTLIVEVSDGALSDSATVTINLNDVYEDSTTSNQAPTITAANYSIAENSPKNSFLGTIQANDPDGDFLTYSIQNGNIDQAFGLDSIMGALTVVNSLVLDFETTPAFNLIIKVSDGALSDSATVTINLTDVYEDSTTSNQAPTITAANYSIAENSPKNSFLGTIQANDPDGDFLIYSIQSGNIDQAFGLDSIMGALTVVNSLALDFETTPAFNLIIKVSDGALSDSATVTINLTDVDEDSNTTNQAPTITAATYSLAENSINGTLLGIVDATDPDGDMLTYTIVSGNDTKAFSLDSNSGELTVSTSSVLDFEITLSYSLGIEVSDGALSDVAIFIINLTDVEEEEETLSLAEASEMIYPNPTDGIINIKMAEFKEATIYNLSGKKIMRSTDNRIDVSSLSEGVYIIRLENRSGDRFSTRLIKE